MEKNNKRVVDFRTFLMNESEISEGFGTFAKNAINRLSGWAKDLYSAISNGIFKTIPSGPKKGVPILGYFDPKVGRVVDQIKAFYRGTPFAKETLEESSVSEARIPVEYTGDDQTVRDVDAKELRLMLEKLYRAKKRGGRAKPIFIYGAPGIGKTHIVASACDSLSVPMQLMDLQFMAPEDFLGIPSTIELEKPDVQKFKATGDKKYLGDMITKSNPPALLPRSNGDPAVGGIIFLDEMNRANKMVLDATMQFVQKGRLGEYQLPDKWTIVAAGNRPSEASVAEFDFALADRFTIINLVPKIEDWAEWAREEGAVEDEVITFIERNEELFHYLDDGDGGGGSLKFPTPRSWVDAAEILRDEVIEAGVKSWKQLPMELIYTTFADQIGPSAAGALKAYLEVILEVSEKELELMVTDPMKAPKLPKTKNFSSILYGISEMSIKKAEEIAGKEPNAEMLLAIMTYFNRYENLEQLTGIYKRMCVKYPDFAVTADTIDNRTEPENAAKIEAAMMIQRGAKGKGLLGDEDDAPE